MSQDLLTMWQIENLRFSVFLARPTGPEPVGSWVDVVGQDADDTRIKGTGEQRVVSQQGPFGGAVMRAEVRLDRIDWHVLPPPPKTPSKRPTAGPYEKLKDRFRDAMQAWLDAAQPAASRMAYGALLSLSSGNRADSLRVLDNLLSTVTVDPENTWDFDYSVNRRRGSKSSDGLMINRLTKWSLGKEILGVVELPVSGGQARMNTVTVHVPMLTLDISTDPEFRGPLDRPRELLAELAGLGTEIALKGDVP